MTPEHENTVLIVDDNLDLCASVAMLVMMEGFNAAIAPNGAAALAYLNEHPAPRFVILDLMMPVMDGRAFLLHKQESPAHARIPVFVATAKAGVLDLDHFPDVVCVMYKPVDPAKLVDTMRHYG